MQTYNDFLEANNSRPNAITVSNLRNVLGEGFYECNLCIYFDDDISKCAKGKRPRQYYMLDGPNEKCYAHLSCLEFTFEQTLVSTA